MNTVTRSGETMFILLSLATLCIVSGELENNFPPRCKVDDQPCLDVLSNTLTTIIYTENPELGIESSDPLFVEEIIGDLPDFKYKLRNTTFTGFSKCLLSNLTIINNFTKFNYDIDCPHISIVGQYEAHGNLLGLPMEGSGDFKIITGQYIIHFYGDMEKTLDTEGKTFIAISNYTIKTIPLSPMEFDFKNLFNGQKDLSDAFHEFIHENWKPVAELLQGLIWDDCMKRIVDNTNKFFEIYPLDAFYILD